jgi:hypothetical protein
VTETGTREPRAHSESGWRILLPPQWITLPTERAAGSAAIKAVIDRSFEGKPRDELVPLRVRIDQTLRRQLGDARRAGAGYLHTLYEPIRGMPVTASLICVPVDLAETDELAAALHHVLGEAVGVEENEYAAAGDHPALRRVRRYPTRLSDDPEEPELTATNVEYVVQLPDDSLLLMIFSTVTDEVHGELVVLFDAIASTLHLLPEDATRSTDPHP